MLTRAGKGRGRGVVQPMGVGDSSAPSIAPSLSQFGTTPPRESSGSSRDSHGKVAETPTPVRSGRYVTSTTPLRENSPPPPQPVSDRYNIILRPALTHLSIQSGIQSRDERKPT